MTGKNAPAPDAGAPVTLHWERLPVVGESKWRVTASWKGMTLHVASRRVTTGTASTIRWYVTRDPRAGSVASRPTEWTCIRGAKGKDWGKGGRTTAAAAITAHVEARRATEARAAAQIAAAARKPPPQWRSHLDSLATTLTGVCYQPLAYEPLESMSEQAARARIEALARLGVTFEILADR
ncbi:hypothetical protein ACIF6L_34840 [Kitasatospora sp. NPDC086009]|uniref:hypothetical protein n=1 Tax=unclassified Kitasatospora TaxID=2633591 RepID=UPI0037C645B3